KTFVGLMSLDHLRSKSVLHKIDELRRANGMEVNRHRVQILNRRRVEALCDVPLVATDVLNPSAAFTVLLVRRLAERRCARSHSTRINFVNIRNVKVNRRWVRIKTWTTTNHHH